MGNIKVSKIENGKIIHTLPYDNIKIKRKNINGYYDL